MIYCNITNINYHNMILHIIILEYIIYTINIIFIVIT